MIRVEISFDDNPGRLELRPQHRDRLAKLFEQGELLAAGPFEGDTGAMIVFRTDDEGRVRELLDADPYYQAPGLEIVSIRRWNPVVGP